MGVRLLIATLAVAAVPATTPPPAATPPASTPPASTPPGSTPPQPGPPTAQGSWVARIVTPVTAWDEPSEQGGRIGRVPARSPWGGTNRLMVTDNRVVDGVRWLEVRLPGRPNASRGWIVAEGADVYPLGWRITISRSARRLTVWHDGRVARSARVVVGKRSTPTPAGLFAIADELRQPDAEGFVGSWVLPLTAHSNVLRDFDGGDGQVALHGRGGASLADRLGSARSHGCVRLANADIAWIASRVSAGTPVQVR